MENCPLRDADVTVPLGDSYSGSGHRSVEQVTIGPVTGLVLERDG